MLDEKASDRNVIVRPGSYLILKGAACRLAKRTKAKQQSILFAACKSGRKSPPVALIIAARLISSVPQAVWCDSAPLPSNS
jgi:hypothetical protein